MKPPRPTRPTVPVLAKGKTDTGRCWIYVRDDKPFGGAGPPAAMFYYSRDRKGEHPQTHLAGYSGILQADAYDGYNKLYLLNRKPGPIREAGCWVHARRPFFIMADIEENARRKAAGKKEIPLSPIAIEVVRRIDALFEIERTINGKSPEERLAARRAQSRPLVDDLHAFMSAQLARLARGHDLVKAINYILKRWTAFTLFLEDGRVCLSNNAAERGLRGIATTDLYCTSSSNARKQGLLVFHFDATRTSVTRKLGHFVLFQIRRSYLMRRVGNNLLGRKHALLDQSADTMGRNTKLSSGFGQCEPLAVLFCRSVAVDFMDRSQRPDTARGPGLPLSSLHPHPVEGGGNVGIGPPGSHGPHDGKGSFRCTLAMFAGLGFANA